jgi:flagellar motor switch protein FliN
MTSLDNIQSCIDVWIDVEAQLDRTVLTLRQIMDLERDSLIKLSRSVDENLDVLIGGAHIGQGEMVVAQETISIRIAEFREED